MKKGKKIFAGLLAASMVFGMGACSSGTNSSSSGSSQAGSSSGQKKHVVMSFMTWTGAPKDTKKVQDAINAITVKKLGIEVEFQISDSGSYKQGLTLALSGGSQIDILSTVMANYSSLVQQGYLMNLEDNNLLSTYGSGIVKAVGKDMIDACRVDGKLYGLPNNRDVAAGRGCAAVATEYLTGIGYNVPKDQEIVKISVDELNSIYAKLHKKYPTLEVYRPVALSLTQFSDVDMLGGSAFGVLLNYGQNLKVENLFTSDAYRQYCERMYQYKQSGYISKDAATDTTAVGELVKAGKLMSYTTAGKPGIKAQESSLSGRPMTIFQTADDFIASSSIASFPWAISVNTKDAAASMKLLNEFYTDPDLANLLSWGVKDVHYQVLKDGQINFANGLTASTSGWNHSMGWLMPNQFITYVWEGNKPTLWNDIRTFNQNAKKSAASGFTYNASNCATEITAVQNVYDEYEKSLEFGGVNPDTAIKEMNSKMMSAGLQKIIDDKQAQLDKWAKK